MGLGDSLAFDLKGLIPPSKTIFLASLEKLLLCEQ